MRFLPCVLAAAFVSGCRCGPPTAVPVTLVIQNELPGAIYVNDTSGKLGVTVKRQVQGQLFGFDDLACECSTCQKTCGCTCPLATPFVFKINPGQSVQRQWDGIVRVAGNSSCDKPCLNLENAPLEETFTLELCYSPQAPTGVFPDGGRLEIPAELQGLTCVQQPFQVSDGKVIIAPKRGTTCSKNADCRGLGELCLEGACTSSCPGNTFPDLTPVAVAFRNRGFFVETKDTNQRTLTGTGTIAAVSFLNRLVLQLARTEGGEMLSAEVNVSLPGSSGPPLKVGATVRVKIVDASESQPGNLGILISDQATGSLLFAADTAFNARTLADADLAPFTLENSAEAVGCRVTACGKRLYFDTRFTGSGFNTTVAPGASSLVTVGPLTYRFVAANNTSTPNATSQCKVTQERAYALWRE
jgi:hypothetical protein